MYHKFISKCLLITMLIYFLFLSECFAQEYKIYFNRIESVILKRNLVGEPSMVQYEISWDVYSITDNQPSELTQDEINSKSSKIPLINVTINPRRLPIQYQLSEIEDKNLTKIRQHSIS